MVCSDDDQESLSRWREVLWWGARELESVTCPMSGSPLPIGLCISGRAITNNVVRSRVGMLET
ncbi:hypothetical protein RRF57_010570 [Xylaria bambusicola]|uniref:Uncharacterized protein n=1 Tax=Xylaria bambusicola TaxID=326684 RepID=A0AAN7USK8_9PEZI